jgi:hypothetical protein
MKNKKQLNEVPFENPTPHDAIYKVIDWLGIGYETIITRHSDKKRIRITIVEEKDEA